MMREWKCIITNPITGKLGEGAGRAIRHRKEAREASARSQRREGWTRHRRSFRRDAPPCPALTAPNPLTCTEWKKCFFFVCVAVSGKRHSGITVEYEKGWIGRWKVRWVLKMRGVDAAQTPQEEEGAMASKPRFLFPSQTNYLFTQCFVSNISMSS